MLVRREGKISDEGREGMVGGLKGVILEGYDIVPWLDRGDAFAHGLDDTGAFMTEHDGESAFGVFAG